MVKIVEDQLQVLLPKLIGTSGNFEFIVFGLVLIAVLKYAPDGLWTFVTKRLPAPQRVRDWQGAAKLPSRDKPQPGELLLDVDKVHKQFGGLVAVNDVSFAIRAGDIAGLIGPNGAGKSTTLNALMAILASRGQVVFDGVDLADVSLEERVMLGPTLVPEKRELFGTMPVEDNLILGGFRAMK